MASPGHQVRWKRISRPRSNLTTSRNSGNHSCPRSGAKDSRSCWKWRKGSIAPPTSQQEKVALFFRGQSRRVADARGSTGAFALLLRDAGVFCSRSRSQTRRGHAVVRTSSQSFASRDALSGSNGFRQQDICLGDSGSGSARLFENKIPGGFLYSISDKSGQSRADLRRAAAGESDVQRPR